MQVGRLSGEWLSEQHGHDYRDIDRHMVIFEPAHAGLIARSLPQENGATLTLSLRHNIIDSTLAGTWEEWSPYEGLDYGVSHRGVLILKSVRRPGGFLFEGLWAGISYNKLPRRVSSAKWVLTQLNDPFA